MESTNQVGSDLANCNSESEEFANIRGEPMLPAGFTPMRDIDTLPGRKLPPRDFVLPGLRAGTVGLLISQGGMGKSFLLMQIAAALAHGWDASGLFPGFEMIGGKVALLTLEDDELDVAHRLQAISHAYGRVAWQAASRNMLVLPLLGRGFSIMKDNGDISDDLREFQEYLTVWKPRLIIIDTLNRALGGIPENDAGAIGQAMQIVERLAKETGAAVILAHHTSKGGDPTSAESARGSSVLVWNSRWVATLSPISAREASQLEIEEDERKNIVRLAVPKVNYAARPADLLLRRGDEGVLAPVEGGQAEDDEDESLLGLITGSNGGRT